jgi:outer membrane immunogenic protein
MRGKHVAGFNEMTGAGTMNKFLLATVSALALTTTARAADVAGRTLTYVPGPVPGWAGAYLGIQGGVARHDGAFNNLGCAFACGTFSGSKTGGTIGALLGYNWQHGGFVYGLEGDWSWVGAKTTSSTVSNFDASFHADTSMTVDWLATIRGRAGLALDSTLLYLTGGVAFGRVKDKFDVVFDDIDIALFTQNRTKVGWTAGGGIEHMFSPHWTARAEFRYVDLGATGVRCEEAPGCLPNYRGEFSNTLLTGTVGVAYKF